MSPARCIPRIVVPLLLLGSVASCNDASGTGSVASHLSHAATSTAAAARMLDATALARDVFAITQKYQVKRTAFRDGYMEDPFCVEAPGLGGMGHHWVNGALVDPVFQPGKPEVMLYAPDANRKLQLVAVEYIVIDVGQPAPTFGGQPFDVGGTPVPVPHWSLHVWVHKTNPSGMFAPFNPTVDCP